MSDTSIRFDSYTLYARFFPAIVSGIPIFILWYYFLQFAEISDLADYLFALRWLGSISLSLVILYLYSHIIRLTSKYYENRYFHKRSGFPTVYLLLPDSNEYSSVFLSRYRGKVKELFNIELPDQFPESSQGENIKLLSEITKQIILKVGKGQLVQKHNIWYGFWRNLIGGSLYSILFSCIGIMLAILFFDNILMLIIFAILLLFYSIILINNKIILIQAAEGYAKQLLAEFIQE